jgi:hypothetical protein
MLPVRCSWSRSGSRRVHYPTTNDAASMTQCSPAQVGAEVLRPLPVVVIGGLVSSSVLILMVLPALYQWFEKRDR